MCNEEQPDSFIHMMRHSTAHLMAAAILKLWPEARFGVGPSTDNGFFYDIEVPGNIKEEDLNRIEQKMRSLKKHKVTFERSEIGIDDAIAQMEALNQPYKVELLNLLKDQGTTAISKELEDDNLAEGDLESVSFYKTGDFVDLCRGPHLDHAGYIRHFKLIKLAGAYWRGNEKNPQLQRIYGLAFKTKDELDKCIWEMEQAKLRDHRRVGKEMSLFTFNDDVGRGLPLWLPNGVIIRDELEHLARLEEAKDGYERVVTPHITKEDLFYRSGHLPFYKDDMYAPMDIDGDNYYLKPMNCPHHHMIYGHRPRSYKELPVRLAEYGVVYRYEDSGSLSGLMRTRGFCQNDAHIYCRFDQAKDEFLRVMRLHARYYDLFDIKDYHMLFAKPDMNKLDKYVDEPEKWRAAMDVIVQAMEESGYPYREEEGEAAFYGPKVDFMIKSAIGNQYAISTNQLDFLATDRFNLTYKNEDDVDSPVYVIHRAPLGSHERFVAFLIEHFGGAFPVWLAPIQVVIIPIADRHMDYAHKVQDALFGAGIPTGTGTVRVKIDDGRDRMGKKIRNAQMQKIPYMLVVGDKEAEAGKVAVRQRAGEDLGAMDLSAFIDRLRIEVTTRKMPEMPEA
ncbi:MAG: threonine--tRNA ligase [Magnetococcales bacterium]|nr:threonine--tRNA ligase [Magnetococcales bacterium]